MRVRERVAVGIALLLWAAGILTAALVAMRQPFWGLDYLSIWGLKARAIEGSHELASVFRVDPLGDYAHPHYPPLWPLLLAGASRLLGGLDDLALTPLWPLLVLSASLLAARATRGPLLARILAGAVVSLLPYFRVPAYPGYADALLAVLVLGAVAELPTLDRTASLARFSAFLVLATLTKSEGVVLAASAVGVLGLARAVRSAVVAGAAVVVLGVLPWALYQRAHAAPEAKTAFSAAAFSVSRIGDVLVGVARTPLPLGSVLLVLGLALVALAPATRRARSGPLLCGALYLVALLGSFLFSRFDAAWHVAYSWDRLVFVVTAGLVPVFVEAGAEATLPRTG